MTDLQHFGVLGMKWGVRRDRTGYSTESREVRKESKQQFKKILNEHLDRKYSQGFFDRTMSKEEYDKLGTKDLVIRKGQTIRRVTTDKTGGLGSEHTFVSYTKADQNTYRAVMPIVNSPFRGAGSKNYKPSYEATYKTLETLRSPSDKARVDAFAELMDTRAVHIRGNKVQTGREYLKSMGLGREVKTLDRADLGRKYYKTFVEGQGQHGEPLNSAYASILRKKGYNSIVDDNDRYHLSESPLIVLDPNRRLKGTGIRRLTADEINKAQRQLELPDKT